MSVGFLYCLKHERDISVKPILGGVKTALRFTPALIKALFTSREGNPSARVTLAGGSKIARVYKQNFTGRVTLPPGTT